MKGSLMLAAFGSVALVTACGQAPAPAQIDVICEATVLTASGTVVATMVDTVPVNVKADSVTGDPRPCKVATHADGATVLNGKDSVIGTVKP